MRARHSGQRVTIRWYGREVSVEDAVGGELLLFSRGEAEDVPEHERVVLTEGRSGARVAAGRVTETKAVALVEPVAHHGVGERHEVVSLGDLRVVVNVAEVLNR